MAEYITANDYGPTEVWRDDYKIHSYEVDFKGKATLPALCHFIQEIAWDHAEHLGVGFSHLLERNLIWVLARQRVKIHTFPRWGETIKIHTWPSGKDRIFCYRDFRILDDKYNIIGLATTTWFVIDIEKRRPQRTDSLFQLETHGAERVFSSFAEKIGPLRSTKPTRRVKVTCFDLDVNEHVNNVKYIEYIMDAFPIDFIRWNRLVLFEISYLAESRYNEEISVNSGTKDEKVFFHGLKRHSDTVELCRAKSYWTPDA